MSMSEIIQSMEREMFDRATREKYYIYIHRFLAEPMRYTIIGEEYAKDTVPMITIEFENGKVQEVSLIELMKFDTMDKCKMQCEKLNKDMEKYREDWNERFPHESVYEI